MKRLHLLWLIPAIFLLVACESDPLEFDNGASDDGSATFRLSTESFGIVVNSRAGASGSDHDDASVTPVSRKAESSVEGLQDLEYILADANGNVVNHNYGRLSDDFSILRLEGLKYGKYSIMFLGSATGSESLEVETAMSVDDPWMVHDDGSKPLHGTYFYKKVDFEIGVNHAPVNEAVELELAVAKVKVDINLVNESMWRYIKKITVNIDGELPNTINVDGTYSGARNVADYDFPEKCNKLEFTVFPSETPKSGYIDIQSELEDGTLFKTRYPFRNLTLRKGQISHINVAYRHPENPWGKMVVYEDDYWHFQTDTMFMADESPDVYYNSARRSFNVREPLQLRITDNGMFTVNLYSPIPVERVHVFARFNSLSNQWVEFAYLDHVSPFMEAAFPVPVVRDECMYKTTSGRTIRIPAMPDLKSTDVELRFETDDAFMAKIATIKPSVNIRFSKFDADTPNPGYYRYMTPMLCRHAVSHMLNMTYMFSTPEFNDSIMAYEGRLKDNSGNPIDINNLRQRLYGHRNLAMGNVAGVGGLASPSQYSLAYYVYESSYSDNDTKHPHNYNRDTLFHEFGHALGYNHSSNMTYGNMWTVFCSRLYFKLGQDGRVPVPKSTDVTSLPYNR